MRLAGGSSVGSRQCEERHTNDNDENYKRTNLKEGSRVGNPSVPCMAEGIAE